MFRSPSRPTTRDRAAVASITAALLLAASTAGAQSYTGPFSGSSLGCFYAAGNAAACADVSQASATASLAGLRFTGTSGFFGQAVNGAGTLNLGTFTLSPNADNFGCRNIFSCGNAFDGQRFRMFVSFADPGGSTLFTSVLDGAFLSDGIGSVLVNVADDGPRTIEFDNGSFALDIDDEELLLVNLDNSATIRATVSAAQITATPEPATIALLASGLLAMGGVGVVRRRRENV